jgi:hypothetical protein
MRKMVWKKQLAVIAVAVVTAKMTGMNRALIVKQAPWRLISSAETTLIQTFTFDVVVETVNLYICGL